MCGSVEPRRKPDPMVFLPLPRHSPPRECRQIDRESTFLLRILARNQTFVANFVGNFVD
jgi:hypothetical protein